MSYCQKHRNHHCVHSHNCKDPEHKKKNTSISSSLKQDSRNISKKYTPPMGTIPDNNEQCSFTFQPIPVHQSTLSTQSLLKKVSSLTSELQQSKRIQLNLQLQNRQLKQKNSHVECQIQYLRSQLDLLINNHNADIATEIKRNLAEHLQLNTKITQLSSALFDKEKLSEELSSENYSLQRKNKQLQTTIKSYQDKFKLITTKNQELSFSLTQSNATLKQLENQLRSLKDKYAMLALAADKSTKSAQLSSNQLSNTKEKLQKSLKSKQAENKRLKELYEVQKKGWQKMIEDLKQQLTKRCQENKKLKQQFKKAEMQLSQLKKDHQHAKQMIFKYEKVNSEFVKVEEMLKKRRDESSQDIRPEQKKTMPLRMVSSNQTIKDLQSKFQETEKQRQLLQERVNQLQTQIGQQKQGDYQSRVFREILENVKHETVVVNEELVLSIGASEEFKRIVEQKNTTIKKLMREKAELYNKIYQQQLHG